MTEQNESDKNKLAQVESTGAAVVATAAVETVIEEVVAEEAVLAQVTEEDADPFAIGEGEGHFVDRVVHISRVAKVVKGGRRFSFSALVVCGDGQGQVGFALGKANEVPDAIRKGAEKARKSLIRIPMINRTIPHDVMGTFGAARVVMKKATAGTGVIAGGPVRAIFEAAGVHDILTKCIGTSNPHNVVRATVDGIRQMVDPEARKLELASQS